MMQEKSFEIKNLDELKFFAKDFSQFILQSWQKNSNLSLLFFAEMGAGKTTLIRELAQVLGIESKVTSPSFVGLNHYEEKDFSFYHFDLYQVALNYEELNENLDDERKNIFLFEWAENLSEAELKLLQSKSELLEVKIELGENETRILSLL